MSEERITINQTKNIYFAQMPTYIATDMRLLDRSIRVLEYVRSKPHNWVVRRKDIQNKLRLTRSTMDRTMKNIEDCGYLNRNRTRTESNEWKTTYDFYFDPGENPLYHGEMPEDYFFITTSKNPNKKNPIAGQQMGGEQQQTTSTPNITQEPTKYKKKSKIDEKYKDDVSEFGFVD